MSQTSSNVLDFPELSKSDARARSVVAQRARDLAFDLGGGWTAFLEPELEDPAFLSSEVICSLKAWIVKVRWAAAHFDLLLPEVASAQCLEALLGGAQLPELSGSFGPVVIEAALAEVIQQIQTLGKGSPRVEGVSPARIEDLQQWPHAFGLRLQVETGSQAINGYLYTDSVGLGLLALLLERSPIRRGVVGEDVSLHFFPELGHTRVAVSEMQSLVEGDTVFFDASHVSREQVLWLSADGKFGLYAKISTTNKVPVESSDEEDGGFVKINDLLPSLTVISPWTKIMSPPSDVYDRSQDNEESDDDDEMEDDDDSMEEDDEDEEDEEASEDEDRMVSSLDTVPVRLSFDLGRLSFTLAQIRQMQPGQTIALARPLLGPVKIRANGVLIGTGDLIKIDGQIGVSVRQLIPSKKKN